MSRKTKIAVGLSTAGVVAAGFGAATSASAESRTLTVTLAGGTVLQVNVDVPPGTPIDQIPLPDLGGLVVKVTGPGPATTPAPTTDAAPATPTPPAETAPAAPTATATTTGEAPASTAKKPKKRKASGADASAEGSSGKKGSKARKARRAAKAADAASVASGGADTGPDGTTTVAPDGSPTPADPTFSESIPGPPPRGVPNFFIDKFRIPPFLLPIYQAAGVQYDVPWEVLAAINEIETDYGRNLNVSTAGAEGWMQFMPATWKGYGVDANNDGSADPYNPVDAIFAAARYLRAAGADKSIKKAIFAYNHADWYVDSVLLRARLIGGLPPDLVGSLTGLTQGVFPISAKARYAGDDSNAKARARAKKGKNAAKAIESTKSKSTNIFSRKGAAAVAVQDGRIVKVGRNPRLGRFVQLRDVYGNTYTYGNLKTVADFYPVPKRGAMKAAEKAEARRQEALAKAKDPVPEAPASAGRQEAPAPSAVVPDVTDAAADAVGQVAPEVTEPLFANPARTMAKKHGGAEQLAQAGLQDGTSKISLQGWDKEDVTLKRLKKGAKVLAGTVIGRIGKTKSTSSPHLQFEVHPGGKGSPRVDPKPILDGWKLLETTAVYRAKGSNPLFGDGTATAGQVLLMSKEQLQQRVLQNRNLGIYEEGRRDIAAGAIDRRVLATMEYLTASGLRLTISSLRSGHSYKSASGNVSEHSSGNAMDIASVNGIVITPKTQGKGSITDSTIRQLLQLQGTMKPHQIISLMTPADFPGADNILALPDHDDHIHVGFRPEGGTSDALGKQVQTLLEPGQWIKLIDRIGQITNPEVSSEVSKSAIKTKKSGKGD